MREPAPPTASGATEREIEPKACACGGWREFLREFVRDPRATAAVAPSSKALAARMIAGLDLGRVKTVVEYGPGTGVFTRAVVEGLERAGNRRARVVAVELNGAMAERLGGAMAGLGGRVVVRHDNAMRAGEILRELGEEGADVVVSGLGWPSLPGEVRRGLIEQTAGLLGRGGSFRTFGYHVGLTMPGAWEFRRLVREKFERVRVSRVVWGNVPPAFVYECDRVAG